MNVRRFGQIASFVALALTLTSVAGCRASEVPLSDVAKEIRSRGYRAQKSFAVSPTDWERSKFRMRSKVMVAFKAEQPLPNETENYYCRFSLNEETYDSVDDARQRLNQLHDTFPDGPFEDQYTRVLREGFVDGNTLYMLQTDAAIFLPEVRRLTKSLAASRRSADFHTH